MTKTQGGMLVAAPERWDEACFAVPAIRALVASGIGVGVLCAEAQQEFWKTLPGVEVISYPLKTKVKAIAPLLSGKWEASLAWEPGFCAEAFKMAGIPRRLGPTERKLDKYLTHPLAHGVGPLEHRVRFYLTAVDGLGVPVDRPEFFAPVEPAVEQAPGTVLLCPESDFGPTHEWDLGRWKEVAVSLLDGGYRLTVAGVEGGRDLGKQLSTELGERAEFIHASSVAETLPQLSAHGLVISADGSLPHLAAHAGATCVTLFGPNDPAWKRPLGRKHLTVRRHVECAPCLLAKCPMDMRCQKELDVGRVLEAVS